MQTKLECALISHTPDPERLVAAAARLCYSTDDAMKLMENMTADKVEAFVAKLESLGHESPFEHTSWSWSIQGVSRVLTHQLVRHRIGCSYSQRSQRYVSEADAEFILPPSIEGNADAKQMFFDIMGQINDGYNALTSCGVPKEDARYVLANATETKIAVTMNTRTLFNFFHHRCCTRAQWEIRALANMMLSQVRAVAPNMFRHAGPSCMKGYCPEATMCCGRAPTLAMLIEGYSKYQNLCK